MGVNAIGIITGVMVRNVSIKLLINSLIVATNGRFSWHARFEILNFKIDFEILK